MLYFNYFMVKDDYHQIDTIINHFLHLLRMNMYNYHHILIFEFGNNHP